MRKTNFSLGEYYHCYNRGTDKRKIFLSDRDRLRFAVLLYVCNSVEPIHISNFEAKQLSEFFDMEIKKPLVAIGAWSIMPNHFHILLKEVREGGISLFMQKLQTAYTMYFNKRFDRSGALFQGTFKSEHLNRDTYLKYIFSYIHLNCIKLIDREWKERGIQNSKKAEEFLKNYVWSSYLDYKEIIRPENKILNKKVFPKYFQQIKDFDSEIEDWLSLRQGLALT